MSRSIVLPLVTALLLVSAAAVLAQDPTAVSLRPDARVYTYPELLQKGDVLTDGGTAAGFIPIHDETLFVWVDLDPGTRFMHDSSYVLISADEIRVLPGHFWPLLNGASAFGTPPWFPETNELVRFPVLVRDIHKESSSASRLVENIRVHAGPFALRTGDELQSESLTSFVRITDPSMLLWVDFHPGRRFGHDTAHILVSEAGVKVVPDQWWPKLNGRRILYRERNVWGVISPFGLFPEHSLTGVGR